MKSIFLLLVFGLFLQSCDPRKEERNLQVAKDLKSMSGPGVIRLITLDPGHFHASLVQKTMHPQVDQVVHVYAPEGPELEDHLNRIEQFNSRPQDPTRWEEVVYKGSDFLEKMISEKPGNVMVVAGNNAKKTDYIHSAVLSGLNVLADKPMVIHPDQYQLLQEAFQAAAKNSLLIYDMMTERYEITTILQKELSGIPEVFGEMEIGSVDNPAISKESVHHFYKDVAGLPLKRPPWFFDIQQEGAGIVDVSTHLVDLILWECFPEQPIHQNQVDVKLAKQWATAVKPDEFEKVTGLTGYPDYLSKYLDQDSALNVFSNGEFIFTVRNIYSKVSVIWNFEAPEGAKDTHFSMMRGSKANLVIRQDSAQKYIPTLYVEPHDSVDREIYEDHLDTAIRRLSTKYPGLTKKSVPNGWEIMIPEEFRVGHEAHFSQVMEKFLQYMKDGQLPEWEKVNMLTKYFITTEAYKMSRDAF